MRLFPAFFFLFVFSFFFFSLSLFSPPDFLLFEREGRGGGMRWKVRLGWGGERRRDGLVRGGARNEGPERRVG